MKWFVVVVLSLCSGSGVFSSPVPSDNRPPQCIDPTFACQDLQSARQCNVVKDCIDDIWSAINVPDDNDELCDLCKEMVKEARDQLLSNMTQEEIREVFEGSCKLLTVTVVVDTCIKLVDDIIPELVEMLASRMDPTMVCTVSGLCELMQLPAQSVKEKDPLQDVLVCEFCTHVFQHIKELITANTTLEEFKTALINFCHHTGSFSNKCTELVANYYDVIFNFIQKMDAKDFCSLIGLCPNMYGNKVIPLVRVVPALDASKKIPVIKLIPSQPKTPVIKLIPSQPIANADLQPMVKIEPAAAKPKKLQSFDRSIETNEIFESSALPVERFSHPIVTFEQDTECAFCRAISFFLKEELAGDRSEKSVHKVMTYVCEKWVYEYMDNCKMFTDKHGVMVKQAIVEGTDFEQLCNTTKICPLDDSKKGINVKVVPQEVSDGPLCDLCKETFNEIEKQLKDPATKSAIENMLDQICSYLPKTAQKDCRAFINQNLDTLFNILEEELQGDNVCPALKLCPSYHQKPVSKKLKSEECDLCKDLVQQLQERLKDPDVKQSLKVLLDQGCSVLPGQLAAECKSFVDENIDTLINILVQEMDPKMVCSALGICNGKLRRFEFPKVRDIECELCKEIMEKLRQMLKDQATEEEIKQALDSVCALLPSSLSSKCQAFVNTYTDLIVSLLAQEMDPAMVCAALNVCPARRLENLQLWREKVKDLECEGCQYLLHFVQNQLMDSSIQKEIKAAMDNVCRLLPSEFAKNCVAYIDEYGDAILVLIAQKLDPSIVCYDLHVCSTINETTGGIRRKHDVKGLDKCSLCTTVVDYLDKLLENDDIDKEITALAQKVCNIVPASYKEECSVLVQTYGPYLLQMIGQLANSQQVCQDIDMCPGPAGHVHLLGGRKCTFGPAYWCQSQVHAASCKAEEYCKQNSWKN